MPTTHERLYENQLIMFAIMLKYSYAQIHATTYFSHVYEVDRSITASEIEFLSFFSKWACIWMSNSVRKEEIRIPTQFCCNQSLLLIYISYSIFPSWNLFLLRFYIKLNLQTAKNINTCITFSVLWIRCSTKRH